MQPLELSPRAAEEHLRKWEGERVHLSLLRVRLEEPFRVEVGVEVDGDLNSIRLHSMGGLKLEFAVGLATFVLHTETSDFQRREDPTSPLWFTANLPGNYILMVTCGFEGVEEDEALEEDDEDV